MGSSTSHSPVVLHGLTAIDLFYFSVSGVLSFEIGSELEVTGWWEILQ
jgi:hypothetical protein